MGKKKGSSTENKLAFFTLCMIVILYLVSMILHFIGGGYSMYVAITVLSAIATVLLLLVASIAGWNYVSSRNIAYKILYVIVILIILIAYILPLCPI